MSLICSGSVLPGKMGLPWINSAIIQPHDHISRFKELRKGQKLEKRTDMSRVALLTEQ